ncbi:hypothetical protein D2T31_11930 [Sinirhodobacter populi]|uniref:Uncharacterized protein n=1 Tax=Paenirhodobacter populi TaxID=2306993 RepID=A0A443K7U0_9RHOB|nr:hypothetical protein [Sinirhodobacter populi]RWR28815.1 hypothetical protein D2T31_11930 [Sinirhodobacter populi]
MTDDSHEKAPHGAGLSARLIEEDGRFYIEPFTSDGQAELRRIASSERDVHVTKGFGSVAIR